MDSTRSRRPAADAADEDAELFWERHYRTRRTWDARVNPLLAETATPLRTGADEKATLRGFLDHLRNSVADKVAGVPEPHVRTGAVPSGTNLLGLLKHLAFVERFYFLGEDAGDWRATMRPSEEDTIDSVLADYRKTVERANQVIDACPDLALPAPRAPRPGPAPSMRWVLVHLIEETGRHAGHADILREQIDGSTGR